MAQRFYLDTSIWRDYFEDRGNGIKPLGEFAFRFLRERQKRKDVVLVSNAVTKELLGYYSKEKVREVFSSFQDIIMEIEYTKEQFAEAYAFWHKTEKRFPCFDVLHSIIARDNKAIVVSRDKHFKDIGLAECLLPEDID